jgi:hypothetical protein
MSSSDDKCVTTGYRTGPPLGTDAGSANTFDFTVVKNGDVKVSEGASHASNGCMMVLRRLISLYQRRMSLSGTDT